MEDFEHNADSCVMDKENMLLDTDEEDLSTDEVMNQDGDSPATSPLTSDCENDGKKKSRAPASGGTAEQKKSGTTVKDKEPHMVQRRNARERRRVQLVNDGFTRLRRKIPTEPRNKKLSKVKTLQCAINYILHLQDTLDEADKLQRSAGMMDFAPVGQGGGVGMSPTQYDGMHHIQSNTHQPIQDGLGGVPMQTNSYYSDWGYYDNMCNSYEYQGMRGNYYY